MINTSIKFDKVEILIKNIVKDVVMPSTTKLEYNNCNITITGEYLIVSTEEKIEDQAKVNSTVTNRLYNLSEIVAYKTFNLTLKMYNNIN